MNLNQRSLWFFAGVALLAMTGTAHATGTVPEISVNSMSAGIALLSGSVLLLRAWRRR